MFRQTQTVKFSIYIFILLQYSTTIRTYTLNLVGGAKPAAATIGAVGARPGSSGGCGVGGGRSVSAGRGISAGRGVGAGRDSGGIAVAMAVRCSHRDGGGVNATWSG
jgi:hypothetical protein